MLDMEPNYSDTVSSLRKAFRRGKTRSVDWRLQQLRNLLAFLDDNSELLCEVLYKDLKKSKVEALGEKLLRIA